MARGLTVEQAVAIVNEIVASEGNYKHFTSAPKPFLASIESKLDFDLEDALNACAQLQPGHEFPSLGEMKAARDAMVGRLLTAHMTQTIFHPTAA
jgi:hypothetical protein